MGKDRAKASMRGKRPLGRVAEVFTSIQGEGIYVGLPQVFTRFYGCNLCCSYCDTRPTRYREFTVEELHQKIKSFDGEYRSISFTGGEPLLQVEFLRRLLGLVKEGGNFVTYLETNGTLFDELSRVIDYIDIIAMDLKLPSSTGMAPLWDVHQNFLEVALRRSSASRKLFAKAVICKSTRKEDIKKSLDLLSSFDSKVPFVLQPNSFELGKDLIEKVRGLQRFCAGRLSDVRVIPQVHKYLGLR